LGRIRDQVMDGAEIQRHHVVLDLSAGTGLLTWEAVRRAPEGGVWALAVDERAGAALEQQAQNLDPLERPQVLTGRIEELPELLNARGDSLRFDAIVGRNVFTQVSSNERAQIVHLLADMLAPEGRVSVAQVIPRHTQRIYQLVDLATLPAGLAERIRAAEEAIYTQADDPWVNWEASTLVEAFQEGKLPDVQAEVENQVADILLTADLLGRWFALQGSEARPSYAQHLLKQITLDELEDYRQIVQRDLINQTVAWRSQVAFVTARPPKSVSG
jgi:putative ATPase